MSDHHRRSARRAAMADGDGRAQAQALVARVRAAEVTRIKCPVPVLEDTGPVKLMKSHRSCVVCQGTLVASVEFSLQLLCYCGHPGARALLDHDCLCSEDAVLCPGHLEEEVSLPRWGVGLARWGREGADRGLVAASRFTLCGPHWPLCADSSTAHYRLHNALGVAGDWIEHPTDGNARACKGEVESLLQDETWDAGAGHVIAWALSATFFLETVNCLAAGLDHAARILPRGVLRPAIRKELIKWILP